MRILLVDGAGESVVRLDENEQWEMPEAADLRDLLSQLDGTEPGAGE